MTNKKQKQGQPQVLRLRCAPLRMTDLWGVKVGRQRQKRIPCGNDNKKAKARATAGPSATLRSAQDDRFVGRGESRKAKAKADSLREWQQKAKARSTAGPSATLRSAQDDRFVGGGKKEGKGKSGFPLGNGRK